MKNRNRLLASILFLIILCVSLQAQVLAVPKILQTQSNWCWAATSACILDYFHDTTTQCAIANYAWSMSGCCTNPQPCNYYNTLYGGPGSIQGILNHFGNISSIDTGCLTLSSVQAQINKGRPFVMWWGWTGGGGHFLIGYGISGNNIYYMDPLSGYEIANYTWMVSGAGSHTWGATLKILDSCKIPAKPGNISGNTTVCIGASQTYSISAVTGATSYTWTLPSGWLGNSTSTSNTVTAWSSGGIIYVTANDSCGTSLPRGLIVYGIPSPAQPGTISGNELVCKGSSQTYSISPVSGATSYTWTLPSGWTGSSNSASIITTTGILSGTISVAANILSCQSTPETLFVAVNSGPSQPDSIYGSKSICNNSFQTYFINPVSGATSYTWTLPSGWTGGSTSTFISTTADTSGGIISVTANDSCGISSPRTLLVNVIQTPSKPGAISGNTMVCQSSTETYSINPVPGATSYTWTLPMGWSGNSTATSITATAGNSGGTILVTANNICGISTPQTLIISVPQTPSQPGPISGNTRVCQGSTQTYFISPVAGASSYTWTLPSGWLGSSTTSSITASKSTGGIISVTANNSCGISTAQTLLITVKQVASQPGIISGSNGICRNSLQTYSISSVAGAINYTWTLPAGWSGNSTSTSINATAGISGGTISVSANDSCGSSIVQTLFININPVDTSVKVNGFKLSSNAGSANWQWVTCPGMQVLNGEINQTYSPSKDGSYAVIVNQNGCLDTSGCYPISITGIAESNHSNNFIIYPNPTNGLLNIKCTGLDESNYRISLTNTLGQQLSEKEFKTIDNLMKAVVDLKGLSNGIYFLEIQSEEINRVFIVEKK